MLSVEQVWEVLATRIRALPARRVPLAEALGLRLAEGLLAPADEPAFDRSAMDGFAVAGGAPAGNFRIVGECLPGQSTPPPLGEGEALRVFTGSALPQGVRVVMQEDAVLDGDRVAIGRIGGPSHVRLRGSAAKRGAVLLPSRAALTPAGLAVLASAGQVSPLVTPRPRVFHLTTGSEVVDASQQPGPGQIRNTNAPLIRGLLAEHGAFWTGSRHAGEDPREALQICRQADAVAADLLLVSGGSSGGAHDHTGEILQELGFEIVCRKVNCRPGKPLLIGTKDGQVAVGLPGNPVSHFVTFHVFVRPLLALLGGFPPAVWKYVPLCEGNVLRADPRETFWPASLPAAGAVALPWLDSGHLGALVGVDALIRVPADRQPLAGELVQVLCCGPN
jgi:molybdopterin molybdotransferase